MAITTLDGIAAGLASGADRILIDKASLSNAVAGQVFSLWAAGTVPAAGSAPTTAAVCTYPLIAAQTVTFRAVFASADANYAWNEFVIDNGGTALKTLNRKVSAQGTKASGQTWTLDVAVTFS